MLAKSLISAGMGRNKKEPWEPQELFTSLRTVRLNRSSYGSILFWHKEVLKVKRTAKMRHSRLTGWTVQSGPGFKIMFLCSHIEQQWFKKKKRIEQCKKINVNKINPKANLIKTINLITAHHLIKIYMSSLQSVRENWKYLSEC